MPNVLLSQQAEIDLEEVWIFISQTDTNNADFVLDRIAQESKVLAFQPLMGRVRADLQARLRSCPSSTLFCNLLFANPSWHYSGKSAASEHGYQLKVF